jgi:hypothetical protein
MGKSGLEVGKSEKNIGKQKQNPYLIILGNEKKIEKVTIYFTILTISNS